VRAVFGDQHLLFQPHAAAAAYAFDPDQRLDGENHAGLEFIDRRPGQRLADIGRFVRADADTVRDE
jgi:hypothetical protein